MGVYIKGMEMPKNEPMLVKINPDGSVSTTAKNNYRKYEAIPVPDHGDLIDRGKLGTPAIIEEDTLWRGRVETEVFLASTINNAPTIIPADKEDGE